MSCPEIIAQPPIFKFGLAPSAEGCYYTACRPRGGETKHKRQHEPCQKNTTRKIETIKL